GGRCAGVVLPRRTLRATSFEENRFAVRPGIPRTKPSGSRNSHAPSSSLSLANWAADPNFLFFDETTTFDVANLRAMSSGIGTDAAMSSRRAISSGKSGRDSEVVGLYVVLALLISTPPNIIEPKTASRAFVYATYASWAVRKVTSQPTIRRIPGDV